MAILYKTTDENVDFRRVREILEIAFGGRKIDDLAKVEKAFLHSQHKVYAYDDEKLIGVARAISDTSWSIIYNVALDPAYQGKGIGKEIINRLIKQLKGKEIFTFTHPRTISLYEHLGFVRSKMAFKYIKNSDQERIKNQEHVGFFLEDNYLFDGEVKVEPKKHKTIKVVYNNNLESTTIENINDLLERAFNHKRNLFKTEADFKRADFVELAFVDNKLIGVARLITDGVGEALLLNVAVDSDYRGYGIGHELINKLAEKAPGYDIFIHTHPKALGFYNNSRDFKRYKTAFTYVGDKDYDDKFFLPRNYRYQDEYDNEVIKYYKGKILN